jgi:hypothetical protein
MICHIVLFTPRSDLPTDRLLAFAQSVLDSCRTIPSIARAVIGKSIPVDAGYKRSFGDTTYSHAAVIEFADQQRLRDYLTHPLHAALGQQFWDVSTAMVVVEIEGREPDGWTVEELVYAPKGADS